MASNIEAVKEAYEFFQKGDVPGLISSFVHDDCVWSSPGPKDKLPWAGTFKGKQEIANFFKAVGANLEFSEFAPYEMIEQGDTVVVLGKSKGHARTTGKTVEDDWAHVFKFERGKVICWNEYVDTAAYVAAMS